MKKSEKLNRELNWISEMVYAPCGFQISDIEIEKESKAYHACQFRMNDQNMVHRKAKITPKKVGQFVTLWKRGVSGETEPYCDTDEIDFILISVINDKRIGQFIFPKAALIQNKILTTNQRQGKRGFRVYPSWDDPQSKQAVKTQAWQIHYFIEFDIHQDLKIVKRLFQE
ncbi:MepB family protein [Portibacter lacus]|uniref:MepB family protein n=1 Tax=Portibacter lacus TaxID=1099794 RepID=A0AA37STM8_9BACT|nr:MepB family protein [Portibacter lacus]GLR18003.1 hypothetical protein GCM10007940_26180 [Portibacter lacus]